MLSVFKRFSLLLGKYRSLHFGNTLLVLLLALGLNSPAYAADDDIVLKTTANAWNMSKAQGDSDLIAAQVAKAAVMLKLSEPEYPKFEEAIAKRAKTYVSKWSMAKKAKKSDGVALKTSGFSPSIGTKNEIFIFKKGLTAWTLAKKNKQSDLLASKAFCRAIWETTINLSAIALTDSAAVEKIKSDVAEWNNTNG
jgi:hypothetical protein